MVEEDPLSQRDAGLKPKKLRLWRGADLRESALLALFRVAVATTPVERWAGIADSIARLGKGRRSARFKRFADRAKAVTSGLGEDEVFRLWRAYAATVNRRRMSILANRYCPDWKPRVELTGREHVDRANSVGRGTILWVDNFIHHPLIGKQAFSEAGYRAWQMSSIDHGFSSSRLGRRFLNPLQLAAEQVHVLGRIEFDARSALAATREVTMCLARNELVRITNNAYIGRQRCLVPFGASARLPVATTPLNIARRTGAAILPVLVIEREPFADYLVAVAPPLSVGASRHESFEQTALAYARYLEPLVAAYPEQWRGWEGVRTVS